MLRRISTYGIRSIPTLRSTFSTLYSLTLVWTPECKAKTSVSRMKATYLFDMYRKWHRPGTMIDSILCSILHTGVGGWDRTDL